VVLSLRTERAERFASSFPSQYIYSCGFAGNFEKKEKESSRTAKVEEVSGPWEIDRSDRRLSGRSVNTSKTSTSTSFSISSSFFLPSLFTSFLHFSLFPFFSLSLLLAFVFQLVWIPLDIATPFFLSFFSTFSRLILIKFKSAESF